MTTKQTIYSLDESGHMTKVEVSDEGRSNSAEARYPTNVDYFSRLTIDRNCDATFEYKHAQGEGAVSLPFGSVYEIADLLNAMSKLDLEQYSPPRIFKEQL